LFGVQASEGRCLRTRPVNVAYLTIPKRLRGRFECEHE